MQVSRQPLSPSIDSSVNNVLSSDAGKPRPEALVKYWDWCATLYLIAELVPLFAGFDQEQSSPTPPHRHLGDDGIVEGETRSRSASWNVAGFTWQCFVFILFFFQKRELGEVGNETNIQWQNVLGISLLKIIKIIGQIFDQFV